MKHIKTPLDPKMRLTARIFAAWHFSFVKCPRWPAQCIVKQLCRAGEAQYTCSAWTRPEARRGCQHAPTVCQQVCSSLPVYTLSPGGGGGDWCSRADHHSQDLGAVSILQNHPCRPALERSTCAHVHGWRVCKSGGQGFWEWVKVIPTILILFGGSASVLNSQPRLLLLH